MIESFCLPGLTLLAVALQLILITEYATKAGAQATDGSNNATTDQVHNRNKYLLLFIANSQTVPDIFSLPS